MSVFSCYCTFTQAPPVFSQTSHPITLPLTFDDKKHVQLKGLHVDPTNPYQLKFIFQHHSSDITPELNAKTKRIIDDFLALLMLPDIDLWVNLAPNEAHRIVAPELKTSNLGPVLLELDRQLKLSTARHLHPDSLAGQAFWQELNHRDQQSLHERTHGIKVWIVPDTAHLIENRQGAMITSSPLRVHMENHVLRQNPNIAFKPPSQAPPRSVLALYKKHILPGIEAEVQSEKPFERLRHIHSAQVLKSWLLSKQNFQHLSHHPIYLVESDKKQTSIQTIFDQYRQDIQSGRHHVVREEYQPQNQQMLAKHYFTGGIHTQTPIVITPPSLTTPPHTSPNDTMTHHIEQITRLQPETPVQLAIRAIQDNDAFNAFKKTYVDQSWPDAFEEVKTFYDNKNWKAFFQTLSILIDALINLDQDKLAINYIESFEKIPQPESDLITELWKTVRLDFIKGLIVKHQDLEAQSLIHSFMNDKEFVFKNGLYSFFTDLLKKYVDKADHTTDSKEWEKIWNDIAKLFHLGSQFFYKHRDSDKQLVRVNREYWVGHWMTTVEHLNGIINQPRDNWDLMKSFLLAGSQEFQYFSDNEKYLWDRFWADQLNELISIDHHTVFIDLLKAEFQREAFHYQTHKLKSMARIELDKVWLMALPWLAQNENINDDLLKEIYALGKQRVFNNPDDYEDFYMFDLKFLRLSKKESRFFIFVDGVKNLLDAIGGDKKEHFYQLAYHLYYFVLYTQPTKYSSFLAQHKILWKTIKIILSIIFIFGLGLILFINPIIGLAIFSIPMLLIFVKDWLKKKKAKQTHHQLINAEQKQINKSLVLKNASLNHILTTKQKVGGILFPKPNMTITKDASFKLTNNSQTTIYPLELILVPEYQPLQKMK